MGSETNRRLWILVTVVIVAVIAFVGPSLIAGVNDKVSAANNVAMNNSSSDNSCEMSGMTESMCGGKSSMKTSLNGCAMLKGTVTSINKKDSSVTIKLKPGTAGTDAAGKALSKVNIGDKLSLVLMIDKDCGPASHGAGTAVQAEKYMCPMHPKETSNEPGKCLKCGMNLKPVKAKN